MRQLEAHLSFLHMGVYEGFSKLLRGVLVKTLSVKFAQFGAVSLGCNFGFALVPRGS